VNLMELGSVQSLKNIQSSRLGRPKETRVSCDRIPIGTDGFCAFFPTYISFWGANNAPWHLHSRDATLWILRHRCVVLEARDVLRYVMGLGQQRSFHLAHGILR
jgi:hypothetical protein